MKERVLHMIKDENLLNVSDEIFLQKKTTPSHGPGPSSDDNYPCKDHLSKMSFTLE